MFDLFGDPLFDDEEEVTDSVACPVCGRTVATYSEALGASVDPCPHVIFTRRNGETTWMNHRLAAKFRTADDDPSIDDFLTREGVAWRVEETGWVEVCFEGRG